MAGILTVDAGTSSVKCSLFDEEGKLLGARSEKYPTYHPQSGFAEQKGDDILFAVETAVRGLVSDLGGEGIDCIGLTGTMNGCIPLSADGEALYPNMIHLDTRAVKQVEALKARAGFREYYIKSGNRPDVHYGLPKLMWLKENEPQVYAKTHVCVNTKDLIYGFLTGVYGLSDYSDASLFGALNIHSLKWDSDICEAAGIDMDKLPLLKPSTDVSGRLSADCARRLGLKSGLHVAIGCGDGPATTHGSGVYDENGTYLTVGSSAWVAALSGTPCIDEKARVFNFIDMDESLVTVCGTVQCASTAVDYMLKEVLRVTNGDKIDYQQAQDMFFKSPPGANGLMFVPTLMGERCPWWDPNARGAMVNLSLDHSRNDMVRAVYEGVAQELNLCVKVLKENGIHSDTIILSGGGMRGKVFSNLFPSVFGARTRLHLNPLEATGQGAAIAAGVGTGIWKSFAEAARTVQTGAEMLPDEATRKTYVRMEEAFGSIYEALQSVLKNY
ncbi:MAG: hypothetical protein K5663_12970 [Clostridiales bacterium]|nr:hypothetical protein [Clostridiales bacterium]